MKMNSTKQIGKWGWVFAGLTLFGVGCSGNDQGLAAKSGTFESSLSALTEGAIVSYEAESLARASSGAGSKVTSEASASGGKYVEFAKGATTKDWIEFALPTIAAGPYDLQLIFKSNTNRGIVQASLDGVSQGSPCNQYAAPAAYQAVCNLGSKTFTAGNHTLRFTVAGKSSSSLGFQMVVDRLALTFRGACTSAADCTGGKVCSANQCVCAPGQITCHGVCTDYVDAGACPCRGRTLSCGACGYWDFESGTTELWQKSPFTSSDISPSVGAAPAGGPLGRYSLKFPLVVAGGTVRSIYVPLCASASVSTSVSGLSLWIYLDGPTYPSGRDTALTYLSDGSESGGGTGMSLVANQWVNVRIDRFNTGTVAASWLGINFLPFGDWSGTVYLDQISLSP